MPPPLLIDQPSLQGFCPIADAVDVLASQADADGRGAVNTRPEGVEFMLDLAGYTACQPLHRLRLLEPSFGGGAFVLAAVGRLLRAFKAAGGRADLADCIRAVELHRSTFHATRQKIDALLLARGLADAERGQWFAAGHIAVEAARA